MRTFTIIILFLLVAWIGCSPKSTPMDNSMAALKAAEESQLTSLKTLEIMSKQANAAAKEGTIAESANQEIQDFVAKETSRIKEQQYALDAALKDADDFKAKKTKKSRQQVLDGMNKAVVAATDGVRILDSKTEVIVDFLGNVTFSKSEIGALFAPGEYKLFPEQVKEGEKLFGPIVEKLYTFANKYKASFTSLKGEIIVTGYSDATPIEKDSKLYRDLAARMQTSGGSKAAPEPAELNQKLSELRANAVKELLEQIIRKRKKKKPAEGLDITFQVLGRGEQIPRGLPDDIAPGDRRRRVVTFYWVVLPGL